MKSMLRNVVDGEKRYSALMFVCPGCESRHDGGGLHMLPVNTSETSPAWTWDGNLEAPTISPSIKTEGHDGYVCHSFLKAGVFEFLSDCTHEYVNQQVHIPDLPDWVLEEGR